MKTGVWHRHNEAGFSLIELVVVMGLSVFFSVLGRLILISG